MVDLDSQEVVSMELEDGRVATLIIEKFDTIVSSQSSLFLPYEDINEMLKADGGIKIPVSK